MAKVQYCGVESHISNFFFSVVVAPNNFTQITHLIYAFVYILCVKIFHTVQFTIYMQKKNHVYSPIILLTENFRCFTGRPLESFSNRSNALYRLGELSATLTSQKPMPCDAANDAPSVSATCKFDALNLLL